MRAQLFQGVELALKLLLGQKLVDLRVTGPAEADDGVNGRAGEVALVPLVVMPSARN